MNQPYKPYSFEFTVDGSSTQLSTDCSIAPINEDFRGNAPSGVVAPTAGSTYTGAIAGVTAELVGTTVIFTFPSAPPKFDNNSNLIVYTATFALQFPN